MFVWMIVDINNLVKDPSHDQNKHKWILMVSLPAGRV